MTNTSQVDEVLLSADLPPLQRAKTVCGDIEYREAGGPGAVPLVLLHGVGSASDGYRAQLAGLRSRFRVIAWDAPGYGGSDPLATLSPSVHHYSRCVHHLLDALNISRAHVIGSSWGTLIANDFAGRYPERTGCVVLSAPTAGYANLTPANKAALVAARLAPENREMSREARGGIFLGSAASALASQRFDELRNLPTEAGYAAAINMLVGTDGIALASKVRAPSLVLIGDCDRVTPPETHGHRIRAAMTDCRLESISGCGHILKMEAPSAFNRLVEQFIGSRGAGA